MSRVTGWLRGGLACVVVVGCLSTTTGPQPDPPTDVWRHDDTPDAVAYTAGCSCGGSEDPEPTGWRPRLIPTVVIATAGPDQVTIVGPPGTVEPAGLDVAGLNLDTTEPPVVVESRDDGSFQLTVAGQLTDKIRLVAQGDGVHSAPLDVTVSTTPDASCIADLDSTDQASCDGAVDESTCWDTDGCLWSAGVAARVDQTAAIPECLQFGPRQWMSFGTQNVGQQRSWQFEVINECDDPVELSLSSRRVEPSFVIDGIAEGQVLSVAPSSSASVSIVFTPEDVGSLESVIFIELITPDIGRWAISLWGEGMDPG